MDFMAMNGCFQGRFETGNPAVSLRKIFSQASGVRSRAALDFNTNPPHCAKLNDIGGSARKKLK
jgi:hypothetical protein